VAEAIVGVIQSGEEEIMLTSGWNQGAAGRRDSGQPK
jgi:hypothetical protein